MPVRAEPDRVLISQPQYAEISAPGVAMLFLPLVWGLLKTYWEKTGEGVEEVEWLAPINDMLPAPELLAQHNDKRIDVLGLSCYTWNWGLQCQIAEAIKAHNPNCLVVAGGPHPDCKDPDIFLDHPYIDLIAVQDGEVTFSKLLERVVRAKSGPAAVAGDCADLPGLYVRDETGRPISTGPAQLPTDLQFSPYLEQSAVYEAMIEANRGGVNVAVWETNRGCPFQCTFCDWGSNTFSKVRQVEMERVRREIDWFGRVGVGYVMCSDANFGMLKRDQEVGELLAQARRTYGFPQSFSYNTAKNNPEQSLALVKTLHDAGLLSIHTLSIQHTSPEVLAAAKRQNISAKKQIEVARRLIHDEVAVSAQLIQGMPGDRPELWRRCFTDLMEWGIHGHYFVFPYEVLPNAPVADVESMERWAIETEERYVLLNHGARERGPCNDERETRSRLLVKTSSYSRADWVEMGIWAAYMKGLHSFGLTRGIALYLRFVHQVSYADFYDGLVEALHRSAATVAWRDRIRAHLEGYLADRDALVFMDIDELPGLIFQVEPCYWLFVQAAIRADSFFAVVREHLTRCYPDLPYLDSLCHYQQQSILLPHHGMHGEATFISDHDWLATFESIAREVTYSHPLAEPESTPAMTFRIDATDWTQRAAKLRGVRRVELWVEQMVVGNCLAGNAEIQRAEAPSALALLAS